MFCYCIIKLHTVFHFFSHYKSTTTSSSIPRHWPITSLWLYCINNKSVNKGWWIYSSKLSSDPAVPSDSGRLVNKGEIQWNGPLDVRTAHWTGRGGQTLPNRPPIMKSRCRECDHYPSPTTSNGFVHVYNVRGPGKRSNQDRVKANFKIKK